MTTDEIVQRRTALERRLAGEIAKSVEEFARETGVSPYSIDVEMVEVTEIGKPRSWVVGRVSVKIEI